MEEPAREEASPSNEPVTPGPGEPSGGIESEPTRQNDEKQLETTEETNEDVEVKDLATEEEETKELESEEQRDKVLQNEEHGDKVLENEEHGDKVLENEEHGDKVLENEEHGDKVLENEEHGDKVLENEEHGDKVLESDERAILKVQEEGTDMQSAVDPLIKQSTTHLSADGEGEIEKVSASMVNNEEPDESFKERSESRNLVHKTKEDIAELHEEEHIETQEQGDKVELEGDYEEQVENKDLGLQEDEGESGEDNQGREELIQKCQILIAERDQIKQQNFQLQNKLYEYFHRKKNKDARPQNEKRIADLEQRYQKQTSTLIDLKKQHAVEAAWRQQQTEELKARCQEVVKQVDQEWKSFQDYKKTITLFGAGHQGKGKQYASPSVVHAVEQLQTREERKEKEVIQVRLENIKLKNQIRHFESTVRAKEELAEGLHLIDFEQLKIENQTYNEKIEERNEELLKLRKKITNTVEVISHLKEKLQFVQAENQDQKERLMDMEAQVAHKRDILTKTKQARDNLRMDNLKLKQQCGLLGSKVLLRDYEDKVDLTEEMSQRLEGLKRRHAELTLSTKGLLKKIDEAKFVLQK